MAIRFLAPGTRTLFAGQTGSGKSTVAAKLLDDSPQYWIIIDPKGDDKIAKLSPARIEKMDSTKVAKAWGAKRKFVAITPSRFDADECDDFLGECFDRFENFGIYVDELYYLHSRAGQAGAALVAILTRGRSQGVTFFGATQRPKRISLFLLSESDAFGAFRLALPDDRKRMYEASGHRAYLENPRSRYGFWYSEKSSPEVFSINGA